MPAAVLIPEQRYFLYQNLRLQLEKPLALLLLSAIKRMFGAKPAIQHKLAGTVFLLGISVNADAGHP